MMASPTRSRLAPRLVLVFAVLGCVFGWGQSVAVTPDAPAAAGLHSEVHADAHSQEHAEPAEAVDHPAQPAEDGHGGHGSGHDHALLCMASSAAPAFGVVSVPDAAALVISAVPGLTRVHGAALPVAEHRAPNTTTLCVQRT